MSVAVSRMHYELPWTSVSDRRFRVLLAVCLALYLLFGLLMPWLTVAPVVHDSFKSLPPPLAHIVLEKPPIVIPPPPVVKPEPLPQP